VKHFGNADMYKKVLKNTPVIETDKALNLKNAGITAYPALIVFNELGIPIRIYDDISQNPPILIRPTIYDKIFVDISSVKNVALKQDTSNPYMDISWKCAINDDILSVFDFLNYTEYKISLNTGEIVKQFSFAKDTAVAIALIKDKYPEHPEYMVDRHIAKTYDNFYGKNGISYPIVAIPDSIVEETRYVEDLDETMPVTMSYLTRALLTIDTNGDYSVIKYPYAKYLKGYHLDERDYYANGDYFLATALPLDKVISTDSTIYLLAKFNENLDTNTAVGLFPVKNAGHKSMDYQRTNKCADGNGNIYLCNLLFNIFAKLSNEKDVTNFNLSGVNSLINMKFQDSNVAKLCEVSNSLGETSISFMSAASSDTALVLGIMYVDTNYVKKVLCLQTYTKNGKLLKTKNYNLGKEHYFTQFNFAGIYNDTYVFLTKDDGEYSLYFIPVM
jgi:hypothetical protein